MLNFGDNAHHSHSDRCQPLTDREARATRCSLRVRAAEWPKGRHQLYGMQAQQSVLFRDLLAVEKIWGHCKLSSKIAEALVWFVRYTFFRKAWFVPLLLYWKQNCSRNTNFTKKTGEKTYERRIGLYDGRRGPLKNDGNYLPHGCRLHYLLKCHILSIMLSTMNCWRGWHGQFFCSGGMVSFFVQDLGLALVAKTCPPTTGLQKGQKWSGASAGPQFFFFWTSRLQELLRHACKKFRENIRKVWLRRANIKSYLSPKFGPILKLKATMQITHISAQKSKCPRWPCIFVRVLWYMSIPSPDLRIFFVLFFPEYIWSKEVQVSHIIIETKLQNFTVWLEKRRGL